MLDTNQTLILIVSAAATDRFGNSLVWAFGFVERLDNVVRDPSRIAAQVVSAIEFPGAGTILLRGVSVDTG